MKKYLGIVFVFIFCLSTTTALAYKPGTLYIGSSGESVKAMQQQLATLGFTISTDGKFGKKTKEILVSFQAQHGLVADGIAGSKTLATIYSSNSNSPMVATEQSKPIIKSEGKCATDFSSKLSLPDQAIFSLALNKQIGQCTIADHRGLGSFCDYYVNSAAVGKLGATGYPKNPQSGDSTGCVVAPTLEKGVNSCWGGYDKETMCTNDYVKNAANQIRQAIRDNACGCSEITKPVTPPVVTQPETPKNLTGWEKVCSDGKPHVQVISPNGDEVYQAGQQVTVKWKSCNVPNRSGITTQLYNSGMETGSLPAQTQIDASGFTINDGQETFTLPATPVSDPLCGFTSLCNYGKNFKMRVIVHFYVNGAWQAYSPVDDYSDNLFTVNAPTKTDICSDGKPRIQVLSPNGGETYNAGDQITVKWKSCNISEKTPIALNLSDRVSSRDYQDLYKTTQNDGQESFVLPNTGVTNGQRYKFDIYTALGEGNIVSRDDSDNLFSIFVGIIKPKENTTSDY